MDVLRPLSFKEGEDLFEPLAVLEDRRRRKVLRLAADQELVEPGLHKPEFMHHFAYLRRYHPLTKIRRSSPNQRLLRAKARVHLR